jgi:ornithine carbamoyltransferase
VSAAKEDLGRAVDSVTTPMTSSRKDFLSLLNFDPPELERCLDLSMQVKADRMLGHDAPTARALSARHVAMLFEKSSLRTWTTFDVAVRELGGNVVALPPDVSLNRREAAVDVARSLERWVDVVIVRTFSHRLLEEFAAAASKLHVINALSDDEHPCQAVADCLTLRERWGSVRGRTIAFVGDGNNVASSLAQAAAMLGIHLHVASPEGYQLSDAAVQRATAASRHGARLRLFTDPVDAVAGVDAVYTDTWTSMGREAEADTRRRVFASYQVNEMLMALAKPGAFFMHCLPAHRGEEVTAEVLESPASIVFDQAENRLHCQKALLLMLLGQGIGE